MPSVLDQIQQQKDIDENTGLALAAKDASWANFFNSTPPAEKLRANLDLTSMIDTAVRRKQEVLAQTDLKAQELLHRQAQFDEWQKQAPLREQLLKAHIDATGATEKRRATEAAMEANDTAKLHNGVLGLYQKGYRNGDPEFVNGLVDIVAGAPHAHIDEIGKIGKIIGVPDGVDPVKFAKEGKAMKDAAVAEGLTNPRVTTIGGKWTVGEGPVQISEQEKIANEVARIKATTAARNEGKAAPPTPEAKMLQSDKNLVGGVLSFGHVDATGKLKPDTEAGKEATHVVSFYQDPTTGKRKESPPIPIEQFKAIQAGLDARSAAASAIPASTSNSNSIAPDDIKGAQAELRNQGFYPWEPDGIKDSKYAMVIRAYQIRHGLEETSEMNDATRESLAKTGFQTADEVKAAFRAGTLPRDKAEEILKNKFGHR